MFKAFLEDMTKGYTSLSRDPISDESTTYMKCEDGKVCIKQKTSLVFPWIVTTIFLASISGWLLWREASVCHQLGSFEGGFATDLRKYLLN